MADFSQLFMSAAFGQITGWVNIGVNLIVSTLVGGLVLLVILQILSRAWGESVSTSNTFLVVLLINLINLVGILGFVSLALPGAPMLIIPILVWIILIKAFFRSMGWLHAIAVGIIGWLVSTMIVPGLVSVVMGLVPV